MFQQQSSQALELPRQQLSLLLAVDVVLVLLFNHTLTKNVSSSIWELSLA